MTFCPACGKAPPEGARFCPSCGTAVPAATAGEQAIATWLPLEPVATSLHWPRIAALATGWLFVLSMAVGVINVFLYDLQHNQAADGGSYAFLLVTAGGIASLAVITARR